MERTTYGKCRCCLTKGQHLDINKEYYHDGVKEIFIHDFRKCFNFILSPDKHLTTLICSSCTSKLREAFKFRKLAVSTERKLLKALARNTERSTRTSARLTRNSDNLGQNTEKHAVFINVPADECSLDLDYDMKDEKDVELQQAEPYDEVLIKKYEPELVDMDDIDFMLDSPHIEVDDDDLILERERELLSRFKADSLKPLPTRQSLRDICPTYVKHLNLLKEMVVLPCMIEEILQENERKRAKLNGNVYITEKIGQVKNAATLLEFSNVTPFKRRGRNGYLCFYCPFVFDDSSKLREHSLMHNKEEINKILKTYVTESLVINVDIFDLKCTVCDLGMQNLTDLRSHLTRTHNKILYPEFSDRVVPFKLPADNVYECQFCGSRYETFGALERHMNKHFRNYICKECDASFVTNSRLKVHISNTHGDGTFPCEICGKTFSTVMRQKCHVDSVHLSVKRFKCNKCPERFSEYIYRQRHLVEVHGVPQVEYKCNVCEKSFSRRYNLSIHVKKDHMKEREFQCETCPYKCFSSKQLSLHMVKHNGTKIFECNVCKKSYARKKTLSEHMKIHNNDKRFACNRCDLAFVQKCSLKAHMKSYHSRAYRKNK